MRLRLAGVKPNSDAMRIMISACRLAIMPQHVRVRLESQLGDFSSPFHHPRKPCRGEWCATFRCKYEWGPGLLLSLQPAQASQLIPPDRMRSWRSLLNPTHRQRCGVEINLIPSQINQLARPQPVAIGD
jgi:hypothetical protein